ncbi:MAG: methyltransferase domain-containing protein [Tissierellia bacterium]|jgi:arsenite methyltransferase|nr:methyltransferase domain-containing protein [Bacillota bacterium]NLK58710.1 methyltransferase domain-containing protein [Tissierellia bacterium]
MNRKNEAEIRGEVNRFYREISDGSRVLNISSDELYDSLGYDKELMEQLPEEVRLGLSCGNPLESLALKEGETLLDLGSGTGMDVFIARLKFPQAGTLYGMDMLSEMVEKAERVRDKKGFSDIEFRVGTLTDMPFPDASIDTVISNCVINLEPDKKKVYEEIYRVLRPGGRFVISDITLKKPLSEDLQKADNLYGT